jgi:hypothetical protein
MPHARLDGGADGAQCARCYQPVRSTTKRAEPGDW